MPFKLPLIAAVGAALLAAAAPAAAQTTPNPPPKRAGDPPTNPVPVGQLQHTVIETTFPAATNTHKLHGFREERWIGHDEGKDVTTDLKTGALRSECAFFRKGDSRCWSGPERSGDPPGGILSLFSDGVVALNSWVDESWGVRELLQQGILHVTGNTTFLGRPALTIADRGPRPSPDGGTATSSLIVDADTYFTLWREDRNINMPYRRPDGTRGKQQVDQISETKLMEVVGPDAVKFRIGSHPHASVTDDRTGAAAKRRAAARRKNRHRRKAARHHGGY